MPTLTIQQAFDLALQHHQAGRLGEAERLYRQILSQQPQHAAALHFLGVIAHQAGRNEAAAELIGRAIASRPEYLEACYNLSIVLLSMERWDEAIAACRRALALKCNYPEAHNNLGVALTETGKFDDAMAALRQAITLRADYAEAFSNLGNALKNQGKIDEAIAAYRQAIALKPDYADAHGNLGNALRDRGQLEQAIAECRQAIALKPHHHQAWSNLGFALVENRQLDQALAACRQAITLRPDYAEAYSNLGYALKDAGQLDEAIAAYRQAIALKPALAGAHSSLLFSLHFHPDYDARAILMEARRWNQQHAKPARRLTPSASVFSVKQELSKQADREKDRRLRIGYVSADFREHPVGRFLLPLMAHHDKRQFEVFAYSQTLGSDAMTQRLRSFTDSWRNIAELSDEAAAELIREDQIDVLVDLTMHTAHNRLLVFARKPAPVQVCYLAYCSTTGLNAMDYRLSDPYLDPLDENEGATPNTAEGESPGANESVYSEKTIRLPETYWCYEPHPAAPLLGPLPAMAQRYITFGCLNNFCKVSDPALAAWAKLLHLCQDSRLLLHALEGSHRQRVRDRVEREGINPGRVQFVGLVATVDYFSLYHQIDIALDPFPYNGGTTTCDTLWMGAPVVTLLGQTAVGRAGSSILSNVGLPELIAHSTQAYVQIAADLANDLPRLNALRSTLRQRMAASPLMDAPRFARNIEAAYRQMHRRLSSAGSS